MGFHAWLKEQQFSWTLCVLTYAGILSTFGGFFITAYLLFRDIRNPDTTACSTLGLSCENHAEWCVYANCTSNQCINTNSNSQWECGNVAGDPMLEVFLWLLAAGFLLLGLLSFNQVKKVRTAVTPSRLLSPSTTESNVP
jgi:hypothetical protein